MEGYDVEYEPLPLEERIPLSITSYTTSIMQYVIIAFGRRIPLLAPIFSVMAEALERDKKKIEMFRRKLEATPLFKTRMVIDGDIYTLRISRNLRKFTLIHEMTGEQYSGSILKVKGTPPQLTHHTTVDLSNLDKNKKMLLLKLDSKDMVGKNIVILAPSQETATWLIAVDQPGAKLQTKKEVELGVMKLLKAMSMKKKTKMLLN